VGFGLCQLPDYYVHEHCAAAGYALFCPSISLRHPVSIYPHKAPSPKVRQVVELLREGLPGREEYLSVSQSG